MTESGPTQPADDLRARIAACWDGDDDPSDAAWREAQADRALAVVEPELARLREENAAYREREAKTFQALRLDTETWAVQLAALSVRQERDKLRAEVSRLSGGNTPADAEEQVECAAKYLFRVGGLYSDDLSPETVERRWSNGLEEDDRKAWREHARALFSLLTEAGWGSAVATPADTQADDAVGHPADRAVDLVAMAFFDDVRLWFRFTDLYADLGGPARARTTAAARAVRTLLDAGWLSPPAPSVGADPEDEVAEVVQHRSEFRELPGQPGRWIATCRQGDWIGSGKWDEVENSADEHYADNLTVTPPALPADTAHERTEP